MVGTALKSDYESVKDLQLYVDLLIFESLHEIFRFNSVRVNKSWSRFIENSKKLKEVDNFCLKQIFTSTSGNSGCEK